MRERTHLDLFSGIGGFALAAQWAGYRTIGFCECEPYCQAVLRKQFGAVMADTEHLRELQPEGGEQNERGRVSDRRPKIYGDIRKLDGRQFAGVDLLTGGFPCQPFSCAGKRRGKEDDRYLWPQMLRVIKEARPRNIIAENVAGLLSVVEPGSLSEVEIKEIELFQQDDSYAVNEIIERVHRRIIGIIIQGLEEIGYDFPRLADGTPIVLLIPACAVDAKHRRDRVWIVANANERRRAGASERQGEHSRGTEAISASEIVANARRKGQSTGRNGSGQEAVGEMGNSGVADRGEVMADADEPGPQRRGGQ